MSRAISNLITRPAGGQGWTAGPRGKDRCDGLGEISEHHDFGQREGYD